LETLLDWQPSYGLFAGRSSFIFPEHSNRVFLGTNTLPMYNICTSLEPLNQGVHNVFCESDAAEENHWIYENPELTEACLRKLVAFLD